MDANIKSNPTLQSSNIEQKQSPTFDPRNEYPDEYFEGDIYDEFFFGDTYMLCQHGSGDGCNCEYSTCNYEPY